MQSNGRFTSRATFSIAVVALLIGMGIPATWSWFRGARSATPTRTGAPGGTQPTLTDEEIVRQYSILHYHASDTWPQNRWLGILTQQNPDDVWITQEIITELRPDVIVETGTLYGGSAAMWATILAQVNPAGRVISVDIVDAVDPRARELPIVKDRVEYLVAGSTGPKALDMVKKRIQGKRVLVILDSDHSREHVLKELELYSPFIEVGGYLIVQDSNINGHPVYPTFGPGPFEAVEDFLKTNTDFEIDKTRERLMHTMHPNGYLKRVRGPSPENRAAGE